MIVDALIYAGLLPKESAERAIAVAAEEIGSASSWGTTSKGSRPSGVDRANGGKTNRGSAICLGTIDHSIFRQPGRALPGAPSGWLRRDFLVFFSLPSELAQAEISPGRLPGSFYRGAHFLGSLPRDFDGSKMFLGRLPRILAHFFELPGSLPGDLARPQEALRRLPSVLGAFRLFGRKLSVFPFRPAAEESLLPTKIFPGANLLGSLPGTLRASPKSPGRLPGRMRRLPKSSRSLHSCFFPRPSAPEVFRPFSGRRQASREDFPKVSARRTSSPEDFQSDFSRRRRAPEVFFALFAPRRRSPETCRDRGPQRTESIGLAVGRGLALV